MAIKVLSPSVAAKIAAGEVVERPASVVKELVENALDAEATDIRVEIREGGRRLIRVADNGLGIPQTEVEVAFKRHATSKLTSADDLDKIKTLGFRGEALPSIAAISQMTLLTRATGEDVGTLLRLDGGEQLDRQTRGATHGTIVTVENLFYNTPARRKFLRKARTEAGHIQTYVTRAAMAYPERRFKLVNDGRPVFQSTGTGELLDVLIEVYGLDVARHLIPLTGSDNGLQASTGPVDLVGFHPVSGYVSPPSLHRSNRSQIDLFANGRWIQDRSLTYAIGEAYRTLLPKGRHPIAIVRITLDPAEIDVNVHPAKTEVRFRDGRAVFAAVQRAVRTAVVDQARIPHVEQWSHQPGTWLGDEHDRERPSSADRRAGRQPVLAMPTPADAHLDTAETPTEVATELPPLRVVGQIAQAYIIAEGPAGMFLIDQHAAHERVLYDQLTRDRGKGAASQAVLDPVPVELTGPQLDALEAGEDVLGFLGFAVDPFGAQTVLVRAVPEVLKDRDPAAALTGILDELSAGSRGIDQAREERIIASICKQGAVRAGQTLAQAEMQALIRDLEASHAPRTCPHGRPTMIHLSASQLEREFGRR
jgi:DNA mismatch repair protein MutL